jgi:hypothetical protein
MARRMAQLHPDERERQLRAAYYVALNEHAPFRKAIADLFKKHSIPGFSERPRTRSEKALARKAEKLGLPVQPGKPPSDEAENDFVVFGKRWKLPHRAWEVRGGEIPDLYHSYLVWRTLLDDEHELEGEDDEPREPLLHAAPNPVWVDTPPVRLCSSRGIVFDPTCHSEREAKTLVNQHLSTLRRAAHQKIREHIERAKTQGWRVAPPLRRGDDVCKLANRLFRRAVLDWTWVDIARQEGIEQTHLDPNQGSIIKSTQKIARELGIPLPQYRGRRRSS